MTKMSSKGQIVIPAEMRKNIAEGEKLIIIKNDNQIILKKVSELDKKFAEDIMFAQKTEKAWKNIEKRKSTKMDFDNFIDEMKKW